MVMCLCMCDQKSGLSVSYGNSCQDTHTSPIPTLCLLWQQLPGYTHKSDSNWCFSPAAIAQVCVQVRGSRAGCVAHGYMLLIPP